MFYTLVAMLDRLRLTFVVAVLALVTAAMIAAIVSGVRGAPACDPSSSLPWLRC